ASSAHPARPGPQAAHRNPQKPGERAKACASPISSGRPNGRPYVMSGSAKRATPAQSADPNVDRWRTDDVKALSRCRQGLVRVSARSFDMSTRVDLSQRAHLRHVDEG